MKLYIGQKCQETLWDVINCWLRFSKLHKTRKKAKRFFHRKNSSFSNNCVLNSIRGDTKKRKPKPFFPAGASPFFKKFFFTCIGLEKPSYDFHKKFQKILCPLFNCFLVTIILYKTRKYRLKTFIHWKGSLCLKQSLFEQSLRRNRNNIKNCTLLALPD